MFFKKNIRIYVKDKDSGLITVAPLEPNVDSFNKALKSLAPIKKLGLRPGDSFQLNGDVDIGLKSKQSLRDLTLYGDIDYFGNLNWLGKCSNLKSLAIQSSGTVDLGFIVGLKNLESLLINCDSVNNSFFLNNLKLKKLTICKYNDHILENVSSDTLTHLFLIGGKKSTLNSLSNFPNIEILELSKGFINIDQVALLKKLKSFEIWSSPISNLGCLCGLGLKKITLSLKNLESLSFLLDLHEVEEMVLVEKYNPSSEDIDNILNHKSLKKVEVRSGKKAFKTKTQNLNIRDDLEFIF